MLLLLYVFFLKLLLLPLFVLLLFLGLLLLLRLLLLLLLYFLEFETLLLPRESFGDCDEIVLSLDGGGDGADSASTMDDGDSKEETGDTV